MSKIVDLIFGGWKGYVLAALAAGLVVFKYMDAQITAKEAGFELAQTQGQLAQVEAYRQVNEDLNTLADGLRQTSDQWRAQVRVVTVRVKDETTKIEYRCPVPASGIRLYREAVFGERTDAAAAAERVEGAVRGADGHP